MKRLTRISLGLGLIFLGLLGFIFPNLQAVLLLILGTLVLWSDVQRLLRFLDSIEKYFPGSSDRLQRLRQSLVEAKMH